MIQRIVAEAFRAQLLTRDMQGKLRRLLDVAPRITREDYDALARLRSAVLDGTIQAVTRRQFRNLMEELVWGELESRGLDSLGLGDSAHDVVAYALNRLPPLYATSEVGAEYQRSRAKGELQAMIGDRVSEAVDQARERPDWHPERAPVRDDLIRVVGDLLREHAREFEIPQGK